MSSAEMVVCPTGTAASGNGNAACHCPSPVWLKPIVCVPICSFSAVVFVDAQPTRSPIGRIRTAHFRSVGGADDGLLKEALLAVRTELLSHANGTEAVPLLDGVDAATLFVPFSDAPTYEAVRAWLHPFVDRAIASHSALLVGERHPHDVFKVRRIQCTFVSNAVCLHSSLPYALNGSPDLPTVTPVDWNELGRIRNGACTARNAAERLAQGDVFARQVEQIGRQAFADAVR